MDKYYRAMYKILHIYKKYHCSYRYFKKASLKKFYDYKKMLREAFTYVNFNNIRKEV